MAAKAVDELTGKGILFKNLPQDLPVANKSKLVKVDAETNWTTLANDNEWLESDKLVIKPDQLIKRRGKLGLVAINQTLESAKLWFEKHNNKKVTVGKTEGVLKKFIVEPFVAHTMEEEHYLCMYSERNSDTILFYHEGGWTSAMWTVRSGDNIDNLDVKEKLLGEMHSKNKRLVESFIVSLYKVFKALHFTYLEINPLVVSKGQLYILDLAAKLDQCAEFQCSRAWGPVAFPPPFGREAYPEEAYIADLDAKSGASLKLTILNPNGRIWTMVAGGGASVVYSDTICQLGGSVELANYGEYSGAPSEQQTYDYARTILSLMTRSQHPDGKVLIIGGGIANFTNVASTFKGIVRALKEFHVKLQETNISIFVRRGGPNYQEGLRVMREVGHDLEVKMHVFGTETHMTAIVGMALGKTPIVQAHDPGHTANFLLGRGSAHNTTVKSREEVIPELSTPGVSRTSSMSRKEIGEKNQPEELVKRILKASSSTLFTNQTKAIIWGLQQKAVQGMLDFDFVCSRKSPSVAAMVYPFSADHKQKFYWGHKEIFIPVYAKMSDAMARHTDADVMISFASLRSAEESTVDALQYEQIRTIAIIAEGIPENTTRKLNNLAREKHVTMIGPATVGGIKPGCFKIGNTGGMMDNILASKLYRPGSVAYVSKSGGMSNELNNIISRSSDGVYEGIAIGGDRYPGTTFMDHINRYESDAAVKIIIVLGEVGGIDEYEICDAIKSKKLKKPVIAWCIGTCSTMFSSEVQFGHAGACANQENETSAAKNAALSDAGAHVPTSFDQLHEVIRTVYTDLVDQGVIIEQEEVPPPTVPMDYSWARELGLIRKPSSFMSSISDERGQELLYAGMPISKVFQEDIGIGGVLSLLWFQRRLPKYACKFFEHCLMMTADHGPAVSGAHNTIVCARAGKDLVSCLTSGLLTIGDRFGGALDGAARQFSAAYDKGMLPNEFVNDMRKQHKLIMGIGHRVKSINNPDKRVVILKDFVKASFPSTPLLDFALEVEKVTTSKKPNLILNVDGLIGVAFVDLLRGCGSFTNEEAQEYVDIGALNAIFVLGRSMGFIGHYLDQFRLKQGLYRHPWDDISYVLPENYS